KYVARLDVSVDESRLVGDVERLCDVCEQRQRPLGLEPAMLAQELLEVAAGDVAHRDVELALVLAGVVDRDDVRMVERSGELRLAQEALAKALVLGQLRCEQLQGDFAVERKVMGPVDD